MKKYCNLFDSKETSWKERREDEEREWGGKERGRKERRKKRREGEKGKGKRKENRFCGKENHSSECVAQLFILVWVRGVVWLLPDSSLMNH